MKDVAGRIAGALAGGLGAWLASLGVDLAPETIQGLETFVTGLLTTVGLLIYGVVHPKIDKLLGSDG